MMETDWATAAYRDTGVPGMDRVTGVIYSEEPGVDSLHRILYLIPYHLISSHYTTNYTLNHSHLFISLTLSETLCGSTQMSGFSQPGTIIRSPPLSMLLESELVFLANSIWMPRAARRSVDDRPSVI